MRARLTIPALVALLYLAVSPAAAQRMGRGYRNPLTAGHPRLRGLTPTRRTPLGIFGSTRYLGVRTRPNQLRAISPIRRYRHGLLPDPQPTASPIKRDLDRRNLLRSRSPMGQRSTRLIGRFDYVTEPSGRWSGDVRNREIGRASGAPDPGAPSPGGSLGDLEARIAKQADDFFELGAAYFRNRNLFDARHCFEQVADLQPDSPRARIADVFVAYENSDFNRAVASLLLALNQGQSLDELRIDGFIEKFFKGDDLEAKQRAFSRKVEAINLIAQSQPDAPLVNLLLAYFAWLNGDLGTAITAVEIAEKALDESFVPRVERFRRLLIQAREAASTSTSGI